MQILKSINEILAFVLELAMFSVFGYYGFKSGNSGFAKWTLAILAVLAAIALWALWAAPKSQTRLGVPQRFIFELFMFLLAAFLLYHLKQTWLSFAFAALALLSVGTAWYLKQ